MDLVQLKIRNHGNLINSLIDSGGDVEIYHSGEMITLEFPDNWLNTINEIKLE